MSRHCHLAQLCCSSLASMAQRRVRQPEEQFIGKRLPEQARYDSAHTAANRPTGTLGVLDVRTLDACPIDGDTRPVQSCSEAEGGPLFRSDERQPNRSRVVALRLSGSGEPAAWRRARGSPLRGRLSTAS
eukprot:354185-Chlamydomonas_euryale.AAC.8